MEDKKEFNVRWQYKIQKIKLYYDGSSNYFFKDMNLNLIALIFLFSFNRLFLCQILDDEEINEELVKLKMLLELPP